MKFYAPFKLSENISETPEGYLACHGVCIARTGEQLYGPGETPIEPGPDGLVHVQRDASEVFRPETMASFEGKAITIQHPKEFVTPENWKELAVGVIKNIKRGKGEYENDLQADLLITAIQAIELVKKGLRELSCGYEADYTEIGVGQGLQKNIIGNHLALVGEGRAGSNYAIKDHKGKESEMTLTERIKAKFAKAQDEVLAEVKDTNTETPEKKEGFVTMKDMKDYFDGKFDEMGKGKEGKDAGSEQDPQSGNPAEPVAKDEGEEHPMEKRMKKLEDAVSKLVEGAPSGDEESEEEEGEDGEEGEEKSKDWQEDEEMTGDSAARLEILAPGMRPSKTAKAKSLIAAYATADGKAVIDQFTGGKAPNTKDKKTVDTLFVGVSEILKSVRNKDLAGTRVRDLSKEKTSKGLSAEDINAINDKHYGRK